MPAAQVDNARDGRDARWDAHRKQRREELLDATLRAIRAHGGVASMDEIAENASTSKTVLYRYFDDQLGLYRAVASRVDRVILDLVTAAAAKQRRPRDKIYAIIETYLTLLAEDAEIYRFLEGRAWVTGSLDDDPVDELADGAADLFAAAIGKTLEAPQNRYLMRGLVGLVRSAGDGWISMPPVIRPTPADAADQLTQLIWKGSRSA